METTQKQIKNLNNGDKFIFYGHLFEVVGDPYLLWDKLTLISFNMGKELKEYNGDVYGAKCKILKDSGDYLLDSFERLQGNDLYNVSVIK
jgi:hypothetical protein